MTCLSPNFCEALTNKIFATTLHRTYYNSFYRHTFTLTNQSRSYFTNGINPDYRLSFASLAKNIRLFSTKPKSTRISEKKTAAEPVKTPIKESSTVKESTQVNGKGPHKPQQSQPMGNNDQTNIMENQPFAKDSNRSNLGKPYKPVVPILYYTATKRATDSINHRLFYINILFIIFLYDIGTGLIDF